MISFIVMDVLERANELQKQGIDIIHLEVGEPDFDVPACVAEAAKAAYDHHLTHYTHSLGDPELRREIAVFICVSNVAQQAGIAALRQADPDVERIKLVYDERRRYMIARLREMGFEIKVEPQGAFYIFANAHKFTTDSYRFAFDVFEHAHVGITPGVDFGTGGEGYVRFSYANSLENIKEGLDRISRYLSRSGF